MHFFGLDCGMLEFFKYSTYEPSSKDFGLCPYNPSAEEVGGLEVFLYEATQNFKLFSTIRDQN